MELDRTERRILGTLIEKRWQTPDQYPLRLGALVAGCNQKSNREPVLELADFEVEGAIFTLRGRGLVKLVDVAGSRVDRFGERLSEDLSLSRPEAAIVAELLLRGPQAAGELYRRCRRMAHYDGPGQVESLLRGMAEQHLVTLLPRETGQRHQRWEHRFTPEAELAGSESSSEPGSPEPDSTAPAATVAAGAAASEPSTPEADAASLTARVEELEQTVASLVERIELLEGLV